MSQAISGRALGRRWLIGGRIQGVGFRPFVRRIADEFGISGSVRNREGYVEIVTGCDLDRAELFLQRLLSEPPSIARPELVSVAPCEPPAAVGFQILPSSGGPTIGCSGAVLLPDQSVCASCLMEMADPGARRFQHPFITCTQCGPRYTITDHLPFDRLATGMAGFPLCPDCEREYMTPGDPRFHAQTMACPQCGPRLCYRRGSTVVSGDDAALASAVSALRASAIVAVKGIGGYHLLCDARDDAAIRRLRARKRRPTKPLAVLFPRAGVDDLDMLRLYCSPEAEEVASLRAPERPIVLVTMRAASAFALVLSPEIAPGLAELGALLPYSPLHELIAGCFGGPLVATSGNVSGEPVLTEPAEAEQRLAHVADAFLHHDRPILRPADDGVVRVIAGRACALRLGRSGAPLERSLPIPVAQPVLALGGHMKVTVALAFGSRVVISPHIGDLDSPRGLALLEQTAETLQRLHGVHAQALICDSHDGYASTRWAHARKDLPVLRVAHHHAHASSLAGEYPEELRWLCFTWDAAGRGEDGTLWGGEALLGQPGAWRRVATFRPFAPPGGEKAAHEPWRSAAALTWELGLNWAPASLDAALAKAAWRQRLNCPQTSSVGRLFDAAAALLHVVERASYEGEGPMAVEALAAAHTNADDVVVLPLRRRLDGIWQADWAPLVPLLCSNARSPGDRASAFHTSLTRSLVDQAMAIRREHGAFSVGLAGGVFQNRLLSEASLRALEKADFRAYLPSTIPCNDAGLSFGQVIEAAARQHG